MPQEYQGKNVRTVRDAKDGDKGYVKDTNQVVIALDDNTERVVNRNELVTR